MKIAERIAHLPAWLIITFASVVTAGLLVVDYATGTDFDFLIFYLIPLFIVTWLAGGWAGHGFAVLGVALHAGIDRLSCPVYTYPAFFYWNLAEDLGVLAMFVFVLTRLKLTLRRLRDANDQMARTNQELQEAIQMKNEFMNIAAHDLKNPLTVILGFSELMAQSGAPRKPEEIVDDAQSIQEAAQRMLYLIRNLLDVARYESRQIRPDPVELDLADLTHRLVVQNAKRAAQKNIILHNTVAVATMVWADKMMAAQVMDNLISNAVKFSPPGKSVYVRSRTQDDAVLWEVQDQGPGISAADQARLFQKFTRLSARPTGGENSTGLGLSIVKLIAEAMHGRVWCESELGRGAAFIVALPRKEQPAAPAPV